MTEPTPSTDTPEPGQPSGTEKRIAQLTKQRHEAQREADAATAQVNDLASRVVELSTQVQQLSQPVTSGTPAPDPLATLLGTAEKPARTAPQPVQPNLEALIQGAVDKALAPIVQGNEQKAQADALFAVQKQSYDEAAVYLPEVNSVGSPAQALFEQIWASNPEVQFSPNGPGLVINAVAGIMGAEARESKVLDSKKQAASSPAPASPLQRLSSLSAESATKEGVISDLSNKGAEQGLDMNEMAGLIGLKLGTARITEE